MPFKRIKRGLWSPLYTTMRIGIEVIRNAQHRYATVGDWQWDETGFLKVKVSRMKRAGWRGEAALAVHEMVEALLCKHRNIDDSVVDKFDMEYDNLGSSCEPGDHPKCPYRHQHAIASAIERLMVEALNLNWSQYEEEVAKLADEHERRKPSPILYAGPGRGTPRSKVASVDTPEESPQDTVDHHQ